MTASLARLAVLAGAVTVMTGCGGSGESSPSNAAVPMAQTAPPPTATSHTALGATANRRQNRHRSLPRPSNARLGRTITTASGAVVTLPRRPRRTSTQPGERCNVKVLRQHGKTRRYFLPPNPGITAQRLSDAKVLVAYRVFTADTRCRAANLRLTIDVNDDPVAGSSTIAPVHRAKGTVTIHLPQDLAKADVVHATARTKDGYPSEATSVLIR
jgi:hypothetical protein